MTDSNTQKRNTLCENCGKEFNYAYKKEYGPWTPKICYPCKKKIEVNAASPIPLKTKTNNESAHITGVFTDGGSRGNPGRGGWGFVYVDNGQIKKEKWGGEDYTTNNRMELTAIIEALKVIGNKDLTLYSDSNICVQTYNTWMKGWYLKGWKKKDGEIANLDLVRELYALKIKCPKVQVTWIKAHAGHYWNEYVDELAQRY